MAENSAREVDRRAAGECDDMVAQIRPPKLPVQERARHTVEKILQAAVDILIEEGVVGLNTNKVADRAGVNIATLYTYFPDKISIIAYLAQRFEDLRVESVEKCAVELGHADYRQWFGDAIDRMADFRLNEPGGLAIRRALLATSELRHLDLVSTERAAAALVDGIMAQCPGLSETRAKMISRIYTVAVTAILDDAFCGTPHDIEEIEELKRMATAYFDDCFGG
ncbi:MAG: TetR/AcrR family transcriptional regulator [Nocardioidaceae bacterium]